MYAMLAEIQLDPTECTCVNSTRSANWRQKPNIEDFEQSAGSIAMCRHCRAFRRQLTAIGDGVRALSAAFATEPRAAFEADVVQRLFR